MRGMRERSLTLFVILMTVTFWAANALAQADARVESEENAAGKPPPIQAEPATQPATQPAETVEPFLDVLHNKRLTGDWGGFRKDLEAKGITADLYLSSIYQQNVHGGVNTHHGHRITGSYNPEITLDTAAMGLWKGGTIYALGEGGWNDAIDDRVGDLFGVNGDATGDHPIYVRELWYEQRFLDEKVRLKLGRMDLAVDIDTNAYANWEVTQFLNSALINTGNLPLPDYGMGMVLGVTPTDWLYATLAVADAQAVSTHSGFETAFHGEDYFFGALEIGLTPSWQTRRGKLPGDYRFILWYDPQPKDVFTRDDVTLIPSKRDDLGFVFNMDQMLWKENLNDADQQGLGMFFRYGYADDEVNEIEDFWSIGAQYKGLLPSRDDDVLGFGFAQGIMSDRLQLIQPTASRESVYELYYNCHALPWLTISPDFQYITNPGGDRAGRDAFVAGLRVVMHF